jgi:hypothetical protein
MPAGPCTVQISYTGAFTAFPRAIVPPSEVALVWAGRTETILRADGSEWSRSTVDGPGVDLVRVDDDQLLPQRPGPVSLVYRVRLAEPFTLRSVDLGTVITPF